MDSSNTLVHIPSFPLFLGLWVVMDAVPCSCSNGPNGCTCTLSQRQQLQQGPQYPSRPVLHDNPRKYLRRRKNVNKIFGLFVMHCIAIERSLSCQKGDHITYCTVYKSDLACRHCQTYESCLVVVAKHLEKLNIFIGSLALSCTGADRCVTRKPELYRVGQLGLDRTGPRQHYGQHPSSFLA
jgi:hypothetical protein